MVVEVLRAIKEWWLARHTIQDKNTCSIRRWIKWRDRNHYGQWQRFLRLALLTWAWYFQGRGILTHN